MGGLVLAMTLVATYTSASSFLGGPGLAASWGLTQSWVGAVQIGTAFLTLGVIGKRFAIISRKTHAVTCLLYTSSAASPKPTRTSTGATCWIWASARPGKPLS